MKKSMNNFGYQHRKINIFIILNMCIYIYDYKGYLNCIVVKNNYNLSGNLLIKAYSNLIFLSILEQKLKQLHPEMEIMEILYLLKLELYSMKSVNLYIYFEITYNLKYMCIYCIKKKEKKKKQIKNKLNISNNIKYFFDFVSFLSKYSPPSC